MFSGLPSGLSLRVEDCGLKGALQHCARQSGRENEKSVFSLAKLIYTTPQSGRVLAITK